jgi:hypothetical protein
MHVVGIFQNGLSQGKPRSVVRRVQAQDTAPSYETLADLEMASMKADLDAFGNPLRIFPSSPIKTDPIGDVSALRHAAAKAWRI